MLTEQPQTYALVINRSRYTVTDLDGDGFKTPASTPKLWKLYTISRDEKLLYVGITSRRMSARIRDGLTATGVHGYHGYKLNDGKYRLDVWAATPETNRNDLECVEAEVAYHWRHHHGNWPEAQNEIHFHRTSERHRVAARKVVAAITDQISRR